MMSKLSRKAEDYLEAIFGNARYITKAWYQAAERRLDG